MTLAQLLAAINTGGVVAVLVIAIWLGLRGDVVTRDVYRACQIDREQYLEQLLRYRVPLPQIPR